MLIALTLCCICILFLADYTYHTAYYIFNLIHTNDYIHYVQVIATYIIVLQKQNATFDLPDLDNSTDRWIGINNSARNSCQGANCSGMPLWSNGDVVNNSMQ